MHEPNANKLLETFPGKARSQCFQLPSSSAPLEVGLHCCVCVQVSYTKGLAVYVSQKTYLLLLSDNGDPSLGGDIGNRLIHRGTLMCLAVALYEMVYIGQNTYNSSCTV